MRQAGAGTGMLWVLFTLFACPGAAAAASPVATASSAAETKTRPSVKAAKSAPKPILTTKSSAATRLQTAPGSARIPRPRVLQERAANPLAGTPRPAGRPAAPPIPSSPPERPPSSVRPSIESRIAAAREAYQAGRYAEVPTSLVKLLSESPLSPPQLAAVYELLASAYVALGQTELAIRCFGEVLSRRPAFALDPVRISPKIRAALDQARLQAAATTHKPL